MVLRLWTVGLAVALAAWTTSCERHSWNQVSELYSGHHHGGHDAHAEEHGAGGAAHDSKDKHDAATGHGEASHGKPKADH